MAKRTAAFIYSRLRNRFDRDTELCGAPGNNRQGVNIGLPSSLGLGVVNAWVAGLCVEG